MRNKPRCNEQLTIAVLKAVYSNKQQRITHIMYKTNLNHKRLKTILKTLIDNELVTKHINTYAITLKGVETLKLWRKLQTNLNKSPFFYINQFLSILS